MDDTYGALIDLYNVHFQRMANTHNINSSDNTITLTSSTIMDTNGDIEVMDPTTNVLRYHLVKIMQSL
jgi:elongation factor P hydroxylase